jgi:hypothetical protein
VSAGTGGRASARGRERSLLAGVVQCAKHTVGAGEQFVDVGRGVVNDLSLGGQARRLAGDLLMVGADDAMDLGGWRVPGRVNGLLAMPSMGRGAGRAGSRMCLLG